MNPIISPEKEQKIKSYIDNMLHQVANMQVLTDEELNQAINARAGMKKALKSLEDERTKIVKPINDSVKLINNKFKIFSEPLENAMETLISKMESFQRKKLLAQKAEEERLRKEREEEAKKIEEEKQRKLEEERKRLEAMKPKEAEKALEQIEEIEKTYDQQLEEVQNKPVMVEPANKIVRSDAGKLVTRKVWKFEIINKEEVPEIYKIVDDKAIRKHVTEGMRECPGVRIFEDINLA